VTEACVDDSTLAVELGCFGESVRRTFACLMPAQRMDGHIVAFRNAVRWTQAALGDVHPCPTSCWHGYAHGPGLNPVQAPTSLSASTPLGESGFRHCDVLIVAPRQEGTGVRATR
jgi:hypothetical protein